MRLWDLRTQICQGLLHTPGNPIASFDQQGLVFGVGTESGMIKLYDVRSYDKGPFDTFVVSQHHVTLRLSGFSWMLTYSLKCEPLFLLYKCIML